MPSVTEFLVERLENLGVGHVFGDTGDYIDLFVNKVANSEKIKFVRTVDENNAGFAADAYARSAGIGVVCANYNTGALKLCNSIAGSYAEKTPVIVISGSPSTKDRNEDFLLHHVVRSFENQKKMFSNITCYSVILNDATKAGFLIDEALEAVKQYKQPVYIELAKDTAEKPIKYDVYNQGTPTSKITNNETLSDALDEVLAWINEAKEPVIIVGVQITRFSLGAKLIRFAEKYNIPMVTTLLSKSTVGEDHPLFAGTYSGAETEFKTKNLIDNSDCLMMFGELLTDINLGLQSPKFVKKQAILCSVEGLKVKSHFYPDVGFIEFCNQLFETGSEAKIVLPKEKKIPFVIDKTKIEFDRFFEYINHLMSKDRNLAVVTDYGACLLPAANLSVSQHRFYSPAFYKSTGYAIPGALGMQLAKPNVRPLVLMDSRSFQISCNELSTILDLNLNPIIFVIHDKMSVREWNYHNINLLLNGGTGVKIDTEEQLVEATNAALNNKLVSIINVVI